MEEMHRARKVRARTMSVYALLGSSHLHKFTNLEAHQV